MTQAAIEEYGWVSKTKAAEWGKMATAHVVNVCMMPPVKPTRENQDMMDHIYARVKERDVPITQMVAAALDWARGLTPTEAEDYLYNLHTITRGETVRYDRLGLACSLMAAYRRHLDGERRREEVATRPPSEYVGEVGQRSLFRDCLCKYIGEPYSTEWGTVSRRVLFLKDGKDVLVWYGSGDGAIDFEVGMSYDVVATPKRHEERENRFSRTMERQTTVNRLVKATEKDIRKYTKVPQPRKSQVQG